MPLVLQSNCRRSRVPVLSVVEVLGAGFVAWMNGGPTIRGNFSSAPWVFPGVSRQGTCGWALLGTWVSVIAGSHARYSPDAFRD